MKLLTINTLRNDVRYRIDPGREARLAFGCSTPQRGLAFSSQGCSTHQAPFGADGVCEHARTQINATLELIKQLDGTLSKAVGLEAGVDALLVEKTMAAHSTILSHVIEGGAR